MTDPNFQSQVDAGLAYEDFFVPALFIEWPPRVADAAKLRTGQRVLDVACGTGVLAREAAARVGSEGAVVGLDPNPGMLEVAARRAPAIEWRRGVAEELPFEDGSFDAVVSQFGFMFFRDKPRAVREMTRVLRAGGQLAVAVWDDLDGIPAYAIEADLCERLAGREVAEKLRSPFAFGDPQRLAGWFDDPANLKLSSAAVATHRGTARFPSIRAMVEVDLRGWLPVMGVVVPEETIQQILEEAERELAAYVISDGSVSFETSAHIVTAVRS